MIPLFWWKNMLLPRCHVDLPIGVAFHCFPSMMMIHDVLFKPTKWETCSSLARWQVSRCKWTGTNNITTKHLHVQSCAYEHIKSSSPPLPPAAAASSWSSSSSLSSSSSTPFPAAPLCHTHSPLSVQLILWIKKADPHGSTNTKYDQFETNYAVFVGTPILNHHFHNTFPQGEVYLWPNTPTPNPAHLKASGKMTFFRQLSKCISRHNQCTAFNSSCACKCFAWKIRSGGKPLLAPTKSGRRDGWIWNKVTCELQTTKHKSILDSFC